jgi:hypothetical protein
MRVRPAADDVLPSGWPAIALRRPATGSCARHGRHRSRSTGSVTPYRSEANSRCALNGSMPGTRADPQAREDLLQDGAHEEPGEPGRRRSACRDSAREVRSADSAAAGGSRTRSHLHPCVNFRSSGYRAGRILK